MGVEGQAINIQGYNSADFNPSREVVGSKAFNLEYFSYTSDQEMHDDIVSYLGEYRSQLKKFNYEMVYTQGSDGKWAIRDTVRGESLHVKAKRVLEERKYRGDSIHREIQEELGIEKIDTALRFAKTGDKIRWMSPPGRKNEGYGTYGFLYEGDVEKKINGSLNLHMSAIRLEGEIEDYNSSFLKLSGVSSNHDKAEGFLSDPRLVRGEVARLDVQEVLHEHFGFNLDAQQEKDFKEAIKRVEPLIYEVIDRIKTGNQQDKISSFNTLENYFLRQKKIIQEERESKGNLRYIESYQQPSLDQLRMKYSYAAPEARGSCGSTSQSGGMTIGGGVEIDNVLNFFSKSDRFDGDKKILCCTCPFCKKEVEAVIEGGKISCPNPDCGESAPYEEQAIGE